MVVRRWNELRHKATTEERAQIRREVEQEILDMDLRGIRELLGKTQSEVAEVLKQTQAQISEAERREDRKLSTLRRYIQALGGELEVIANFGDKRIRLHGI